MKYALAALSTLAWTTIAVEAAVAVWGQCGGLYYTGDKNCASGSTCVYSNDWYSQCLPGAATTSTTSKTSTTTTSTTRSTTSTTTTTSSTPTTTSTTSTSITTSSTTSTSPPAYTSGFSTLAGVNIAGLDFGCDINGNCTGGGYEALAIYGGPDGLGQMQHFYAGGMNTFRLPVGWQYLTPTLGGTLDPTVWAKYDALVQACLSTGAHCIIDIHNYARWFSNIIGQSNGAVTNDHFVSLWTQIATKYASQPKVHFGLMNEPHDVPDINAWAATVQLVVTAIRNAGATTQYILLPGNNWTSAGTFVSSGSAAALGAVTNPDGSKKNLIFDVHKYLDSDNSGTHTECVTDNVADTFAPLATYLRANGRMAILTETGGGNVASCVQYMCNQLNYIRGNPDVYLGYTGWSAGSFDSTYNLSETPVKTNGVWVDTLLVKSCFYQGGSSSTTSIPSTTSTSTTSSSKTSTTTLSSPITTVISTTTTTSSTSTTSKPATSAIACTSTLGNPYTQGATIYLSPYYIAEVNAAIAGMTSSTLKAKAAALAKVPNFTWLDTADKVPTLSTYLADAQSQGSNMLVQIVIYDLPNRDCHAKASNGEYSIANNGVANYKAYINAISSAVSAYPGVRIVAVVEPDSLANLVTNLSDPNCQNAASAYKECTTYALATLKQCNIWLYLDAGHAGWLGWPANIGPAATMFTEIYKSATPNRVRGLATNVANYNALSAATPDTKITQSNPNTDELKYITALGPSLVSAGFPASFIVDQGRAGVQGIRSEWGNWCNIKGAGFGLRPTSSTPSTYIDAIVWVKPGGECDGTSNSSAPRYDSTCSLSDAKVPAPQAGQWFEAYFEDLLTYANPAF